MGNDNKYVWHVVWVCMAKWKKGNNDEYVWQISPACTTECSNLETEIYEYEYKKTNKKFENIYLSILYPELI